jgi:hypothetical protein
LTNILKLGSKKRAELLEKLKKLLKYRADIPHIGFPYIAKNGIRLSVGLLSFINARLERPVRAGAADEARTNIGRRAVHNDLLNNPPPCARCAFRRDFVTRSAA